MIQIWIGNELTSPTGFIRRNSRQGLLFWKKISIFELYQKREQLWLIQNYREFPKASKPYCMPNWMNTTEAEPPLKRQGFIWWCCPDRESPTIPCLSAIKGVNQAFARFTPFFTPKNVKLGVFVFFKILQKNVNYKAIGISMDWQNEPLWRKI